MVKAAESLEKVIKNLQLHSWKDFVRLLAVTKYSCVTLHLPDFRYVDVCKVQGIFDW